MAGMFETFFGGPQASADGGFNPKTMGMLALAGSLLEAGAPSLQPRSVGSGLGRGAQNMFQAQQQAQQAELQRSIFDLQKRDFDRKDAESSRNLMARDRLFTALSNGGTDMGRPVDMKPLWAQAFPDQFASSEFDKLKPKPLINVAEGGSVFDPNQNKTVMTGPPKMTEFTQKIKALTDSGVDPREAINQVMRPAPQGYTYQNGKLQVDPNWLDTEKQLRAAGANRVDINQSQERAENSAYGGQLVAEYKTIAERAASAEDARNQLRIARTTSEPGGAELPSALQQRAGNVVAALGMNVDSPTIKGLLGSVTNGQQFNGTIQNLVLTKMQAQKGPQTENDAKRIESTVASLGNTPAARDFLMRAADALSYEDMLKREFWDNHRGEKGSFDGAQVAWRKFKNDLPMVGQSPNTGKPVFFSEFAEANRGKPYAEIVKQWSSTYGR